MASIACSKVQSLDPLSGESSILAVWPACGDKAGKNKDNPGEIVRKCDLCYSKTAPRQRLGG